MKKSIFVLAVFGVASVSHGQETYHSRLSKGEVMVQTAKVAGSSIPEATVTAVVDASPEKVWKIIEDCNKYPKTMIRVKEAKELSRSGSEIICEVTAEMPWPISDLTAKTLAKHTIGPPVWSREWNLIEGDYESNKGSWRIQSFDLENTRSLVVYKVHAVPNISVPDALIRKAHKDSLPDLMRNLRKKVK